MKKIILLITLTFLLLGCTTEIDTGQEDCKELTSGLVGLVGGKAAETDCTNRCQQEGNSYKQWKCNEENHVVCVCE